MENKVEDRIEANKNLPSRETQEKIIEVSHTELALPKAFVFTLKTATPSVKHMRVGKLANAGATTITDFLDGAEGQTIKVLGDGQSTFDDGTKIKTNTGADKLAAVEIVYTFTRINSVWYEDE